MLDLVNVSKTFSGPRGDRRHGASADVAAVADLSLEVKEGQLFTLLGPSGCGKTTTLRMIAGLERPDHGIVRVRDRILFDAEAGLSVPPHRRGLGMVFQSYAIWPHMSVYKNVAFPLAGLVGGKRIRRAEVQRRVARALEAVHLGDIADRPATDLSGGQQQRLALARALIIEPQILLLDEPLSNLDAKLRAAMRLELKRIQRDLGITTIYVTHDQVEALAMSNVIAVMNSGKVAQIGRPREIYDRPHSRFVADFIGSSNFLEATVRASAEQNEMWRISTPCGELFAVSAADFAIGEAVTATIRPEHIEITSKSRSEPMRRNTFSGRVTTRGFLGEAVDYEISLGEHSLRARCHPDSSLPPGTEVDVHLPERWVSLLPN